MADISRKRKASEAFTKQDTDGTAQKHMNQDGNRKQSLLRQKAEALSKTRQELPIWPHIDEIRQKINENDVLLLVGETGSGKSTQIPQFLITEPYCQAEQMRQPPTSGVKTSKTHPRSQASSQHAGHDGPKGRIAILQPRRVAAISLAARVAAEVGTPIGSSSPASTVGYSVRFDNNVSPNTKIKFLTDGMLLQELLRDPWLKEYSVVVVDEVHERGLNVDLVMGFLRRIIVVGKTRGAIDGRNGNKLRVVVMSATADMEGIKSFFADPKSDGSKEHGGIGVSKPVNMTSTTENDGWDGFSDSGDVDDIQSTPKSTGSHASPAAISVASCYVKGRQYPVTINYEPKSVNNLLDTAMKKIMHIHEHTPLPGDVLVFLSGQEMIENLESLCHTYELTVLRQRMTERFGLKLPSLQILPLFASLPTNLQSRIFQSTPRYTRRIILSTNIAETSLTVPNIRHVIDTGKHKSRHFRPGLNLDTLLSQPISRSSAAQRSGRAGREAPGSCWRLYTQHDFYNLEADTKPEILQTDLSFLVLTLKAHGVKNVLEFPLLTRPPRPSLEVALEHLLNLDALDAETGEITPTGRKMSLLPLRADLARSLLASTTPELNCTNEVIDIVAALSLEEGIFLPIHNKSSSNHSSNQNLKDRSTRELLLNNTGQDPNPESDSDTSSPQEQARRKLLSRHSDHLTLLNAIQAYASPTTHDRRAWCDTHAISHRAMSRIMDVRKQLQQIMSSTKLHLNNSSQSNDHIISTSGTGNGGEDNSIALRDDFDLRTRVLKALLAGLWPNVAILTSLATQQAQAASGSGSAIPNPNQRAPYTTLLTNQGIHVHPSSTMFVHRSSSGSTTKREDEEHGSGKKGKRSEKNRNSGMARAIIFTDLVYTTKAYARNVSSIELAWVAEMGRLS